MLNYDRIVVMDQGAIAESGTPEQLSNKEGELFVAMIRDTREQDAQKAEAEGEEEREE